MNKSEEIEDDDAADEEFASALVKAEDMDGSPTKKVKKETT